MSDKKRVLFVIGTMNCGGAENMVMAILRHIDRISFDVEFLINFRDEKAGYFDDEISELGVKVHYIKSQGALGPWRYVLFLKKFLLDKGPYDIVHSHLDWQGGLIALASHLAKSPCVIAHAHTSNSGSNRLSVRILLPLQKWLIRHYANEYWACSYEAGDFVFGTREDVRVIPNAINLDRFLDQKHQDCEDMRGQWGCGKDTLVLAHAGSFSEVKNQDFLVDIAKCLEKRGVDYRLILAGDSHNEYGRRLKNTIRGLGLTDRVKLIGVRDDLPLVFSSCDCFLFPSLYEGLGIVCVEAQAAGLRCLLSPGIPGEVDMGLNLTKYVEHMNPEKWAEEILATLGDKVPSKQTIVEQIRERGFDIKYNTLELEKLYQSF